ncbi:MAG TPA: SDR family oxidoreductase [Steroidobacteraceae bacterium]|nr:SDR family oxidoreductase [Steroidobacteraceae bacterium]
MKLEGAKVLITGASGGIGTATAQRLAAAGARVLLVGRDSLRLEALARRLERTRGSAAALTADITTSAGREAIVETAGRWQGGIDAIVNLAGTNHFGMFEQQSTAEVERIVSTNALAPMLLCHALLPVLRARPQAHIVNVGSILGSIALPGNAAYSASKFALRGFSEALRRELADTRIRVHYVAPRATATAFNQPEVEAMNRDLKVAMDPPELVAAAIESALNSERAEMFLGWPEKLFVRLNAILPRLVDRALRKQLPVVQHHAGALVAPEPRRSQSGSAEHEHRHIHANG